MYACSACDLCFWDQADCEGCFDQLYNGRTGTPARPMHRIQQSIRIGYTELVLQLVPTIYGSSCTFLELSECLAKNWDPHSQIFGPKFLFGPKIASGQYIKVFWPQKVGPGASQGAQWTVLGSEVKITSFQGQNFFFDFSASYCRDNFFLLKP